MRGAVFGAIWVEGGIGLGLSSAVRGRVGIAIQTVVIRIRKE